MTHDELMELLRQLTDPRPCRYDEDHDVCRAHSQDARPCPHERATQLLISYDLNRDRDGEL